MRRRSSSFAPGGLGDHGVAHAVTPSVAADLRRREWAMPVGNAAVSLGLLSFYLGTVWTRTLPAGADSSRIAAPAMAVLGLVSMVVGHRLRKGRQREVTEAIAALALPPARGPHLRPSVHQVPRRTYRRRVHRCRTPVHHSSPHPR